ncbi:MAG: ribosome recycling factor [Chlamydiales bacterium]|jgi:ribosome recycling factor
MSVTDQTENKMKSALEHLREDLKSIRTGRAHPAILDSVMVEVYGASMRLKDIASIAIPEPRQLLITPFDPNNSSTIGKAIEKANLNLQPITEGNAVRINIPPMDEALRKEMCKLVNKKKEDGKISIRNIRRESNDLIKKQKSDGDISEDLVKKIEKQVQELTDQYCKQADEIAVVKEKDILTV